MNKIPTAEEFLSAKYGAINTSDKQGTINGNFWTALQNEMIEFAKLHVQAALQAAAEQVKLSHQVSTWKCEPRGVQPEVDKQSILNAYPDELIK